MIGWRYSLSSIDAPDVGGALFKQYFVYVNYYDM